MPNRLTEHNYKCTNQHRSEIHEALAKEYEALSNNSNEKKIKLFNGIFQQELAGKYIYLFSLPKEHERQIEIDKPYIFSIDNTTLKGSIVSILREKLEIEIELFTDKGKTIPTLEIIIDLKVLIDLIDRRIVAIDREPTRFFTETASFLFNPKPNIPVPYLENKIDHLSRNDGIKLIPEQVEAIQATLKQKLTLIWGPPGTGKTVTLQGVIAELLLSGHKVLFASNTNNAIDGLLKSLTGEKNPYQIYHELKSEGKIVRIGSQTDEEVKKVFGSFEVAKYKAEEIQNKILDLQDIIEKKETVLKELQDELRQIEYAQKLKNEISNLEVKLIKIKSKQDFQDQINLITEHRDNLNLCITESKKAEERLKSIEILSEKIENQKKRVTGINAIIHKTKSEIEHHKKEGRIIQTKIVKLENAFLGRFRNKKEIESLIQNHRKITDKINESASNLRRYESQQTNEIILESELIGEFVESLSQIKTIITSIDFKREIFKNNLALLELEYNFKTTLNPWVSLGIEYNLINEEQANEISYFSTLGYTNFELIPIHYEKIIAKLNKQIDINEQNRISFETELKNREKEYANYKHLLSKSEDYWKEVVEKIKQIQETVAPLQLQIDALNNKIRDIEKNVIKESMLICCTMVKSSYDEILADIVFDTLVVDETSMVSLPQLYCTSSLIRDRVVLCGDHLQLQPISISRSEVALKWLASSYYDLIELNGELSTNNYDEDSDRRRTVKRAGKLRKLNRFQKILSQQYRMPTEIANLIRPWYRKAGNHLKDNYQIPKDFKDATIKNHFLFSNNNNIFFFDTSKIGTYHSRSSEKSPYNLINAAIVAEISRELIEEYKIKPKDIRCISPYRAQYLLTSALLSKFLPDEYKIEIPNIASSVHKMQGGEAPIVFYDLTDGSQQAFTSFIKTEDFHIHNVAISRSKYKIVFVGDLTKLNRLREKSPNSALNDILPMLNKSNIIDSKPLKEKIFKQFTERDLINANAIFLTEEQRNNILVLTSYYYFSFLQNDIRNANNSILIISPFITKSRWNKLKESLLDFQSRSNGTITIITRPPDKMYGGDQLNMAVVAVLNEFINHGFIVKLSPKIHSKLVVIDRGTDNAIAYWGSLNPLSFSNTDEVNTRLRDKHIAEQLINMSMVGNIYPYRENTLDKTLIHKHTAETVKKQLKDFRWTLATYYHYPLGAICSNDTIDKIVEMLTLRYKNIQTYPQFNRRNFVLWKHIKEIEEIISPLREFLKNKVVGERTNDDILIDFNSLKPQKIEVGDLFELENSGIKKLYRITKQNVGYAKLTSEGIILVNHRAPIAKSVLGKKVDEICKLENQDTFYKIVSIKKK